MKLKQKLLYCFIGIFILICCITNTEYYYSHDVKVSMASNTDLQRDNQIIDLLTDESSYILYSEMEFENKSNQNEVCIYYDKKSESIILRFCDSELVLESGVDEKIIRPEKGDQIELLYTYDVLIKDSRIYVKKKTVGVQKYGQVSELICFTYKDSELKLVNDFEIARKIVIDSVDYDNGYAKLIYYDFEFEHKLNGEEIEYIVRKSNEGLQLNEIIMVNHIDEICFCQSIENPSIVIDFHYWSGAGPIYGTNRCKVNIDDI